MISVRDAAKNALNFYKDIYPEISGELIEEVEFDSTRQYWLITLSFPMKVDNSQSPLSNILQPKFERKYKTFEVDAKNGEVVSMKIRLLENERN
ncbi:hypothetical protein [Spirosoma luteum]|uniref:hypothetical protein n=1 Tax=Spirosoma luteum TaxID=431553 RepID=UPI00036850AD|nr:hypothetical protein [Spirosoma luteum]